jgi:hypothetical protein
LHITKPCIEVWYQLLEILLVKQVLEITCSSEYGSLRVSSDVRGPIPRRVSG